MVLATLHSGDAADAAMRPAMLAILTTLQFDDVGYAAIADVVVLPTRRYWPRCNATMLALLQLQRSGTAYARR